MDRLLSLGIFLVGLGIPCPSLDVVGCVPMCVHVPVFPLSIYVDCDIMVTVGNSLQMN